MGQPRLLMTIISEFRAQSEEPAPPPFQITKQLFNITQIRSVVSADFRYTQGNKDWTCEKYFKVENKYKLVL